MSTALRLYRELTTIDPSRPAVDPHFHRERKNVLDVIHSRDNHVTISKSKKHSGIDHHHGKMARVKASSAPESIDVIRNKKQEQDIIKNADRMNEIIKQFSSQLERGEHIPDRFFRAIEGDHQSESLYPKSSQSKSIRSSSHSASLSSGKPSTACPVIIRPSHKETLLNTISPLKSKKPSSSKVWSPDEIRELNVIYNSIAKPMNRDKSHWDMYFHSFESRFQSRYPMRTRSGIKGKIHELMATNRFHFDGEDQYWSTGR